MPVDPSVYGAFHSGDCYLVLFSYYKRANSTKLDSFLHYWQGEGSSQDERGASAYRAVELDDALGGTPVQVREVQGHESSRFLAYFPGGIRYLDGGIETAFRHVDPDAYQPRLFQIKGAGARSVRSVQVSFGASSLNQGDVFILDAGLTIYQWNGASSNRAEQFHGLQTATKIKDSERGGKARLVFLESGESSSDSSTFFSLLKGSPSDVKSAADGGDDLAVQKEVASLWRMSDATGSLVIGEVARAPLARSLLDEDDVFLLDAVGEVFVWIGSRASKDERAKGMEYGAKYLAQKNRPAWTPLTRLPSGGETVQFKANFVQFDAEPTVATEKAYVPKERKIEMAALLEQQQKAEEKMIDNGSGEVTVWRIAANHEKEPVPKASYGQFFSGDSYIVLYRYKNAGRDSYLLYMWQGRDSTTDEKTASALLTVDLSAGLQDLPGAQVRVVQNKEPSHFLSLFAGKMVVRTGDATSAAASAASGTHLFHIRGTSRIDTRGVEVASSAASLNSSDCFVLLTDSTVFNWAGQGSNQDERATASSLAQKVLAPSGANVTDIQEGSEPEDFWTALGGKQSYANARQLRTAVVEPRLFQVTGVTASGNFVAEEVFTFSQDDLVQDGVFILDTVAEVYVWIGQRARQAEKDAALTMALQYVKTAPDGRSESTPVFRLTAGAEPPTFTAQFLGWSLEKSQDFTDPYAKKLAALKGQAATPVNAVAPDAAAAAVQVTSVASNSNSKQYSLAELQAGTPSGVEAAKKEAHLADGEFKSALGVDRDAFYKLAGWKQAELKKKAGIF